MTQSTDITLSNQSGANYRTEHNSINQAFGSTHQGSTPPSYAVSGMHWIDNTAIPWVEKVYDGTDWIAFLEIDPTTNSANVLNNAEGIQDIVGAMFSGNTETNITVTYQDGDGTIDLVVPSASTTVLGVVEKATSGEMSSGTADKFPDAAEVKTYVDTAIGASSALTLGTVQTTTSGTAKTFTGVPANTKAIHLLLSGVSTNGTARLFLTLGDAGGLETTGYQNTTARDGASTSSVTSGFTLTELTGASDVYNGIVTLRLLDAATFTWVLSANISSSVGGPFVHVSAGVKSLSAALTQLSFTTENGVDTFDSGASGKINIQYET